MQQEFRSKHWDDKDGNPAGGISTARGVDVIWQDGPLMMSGVRVEPNGAFVETVLAIAADRLEYYQGSRFSCQYNADALEFIRKALERLNARTRDREMRGVEGTHKE